MLVRVATAFGLPPLPAGFGSLMCWAFARPVSCCCLGARHFQLACSPGSLSAGWHRGLLCQSCLRDHHNHSFGIKFLSLYSYHLRSRQN
jgi:hypothetical protein